MGDREVARGQLDNGPHSAVKQISDNRYEQFVCFHLFNELCASEIMARKFRKRFGALQQWHFHPKCPHWPIAEYQKKPEVPRKEEICYRCIILNAKDPVASIKQK